METDPCRQPRQLRQADMKPCVVHKNVDYFRGSEMTYIFGLILLVSCPLLVAFLAHLAIKADRNNTDGSTIKQDHCKQNWANQGAPMLMLVSRYPTPGAAASAPSPPPGRARAGRWTRWRLQSGSTRKQTGVLNVLKRTPLRFISLLIRTHSSKY